jgi:uncharacterized OB-fold protein
MYEKPLPVIDPDSQPYWDALRSHRLMLRSCKWCGQPHFYPRSLCPHCHCEDLQWIEASGCGVIYSYTVARKPAGPAFKADVPYVVAIVQLDEGPRMMTRIVTTDPASVHIGAAVQVVYDDVAPDLTLPTFALNEK